MSGFTEEEFEPDPGGAKAGDTTADASETTANANGHDTGNNAGGNAGYTAGSTAAGGSTAGGNAGNTPRPELGAAAYHGLAGEVVNTLAGDRGRPGRAAGAVSRLFWQRRRPRAVLSG